MINRVVLTGRMTRDPELRYSPQGTAVANFTLAVNRAFSKKEEADFPQVVCFKKTAENTANFCKKGSLVGVEGRIQTRSYDGKNGKVFVTEVVADNVVFLEPKNSQSKSPSDDPFGGQEVEMDDPGNLPF